MRRGALVCCLFVLLVWPAAVSAQSTAVARGGSAVYTGLAVMLGTVDAPHHLFLSFEAQCMDTAAAALAVSPEARDAVLTALRQQDAAVLSTEKGKEALKTTLVSVLNKTIGSPRVVRVLYTQFKIV